MKATRITALLAALLLAVTPLSGVAEPLPDPAATLAPGAEEPPAADEPAADVPVLEDMGVTLGDHAVRYPRLTGLQDEALEEAVNARLLTAGRIDERLTRLAQVMGTDTPLTVTWQGSVMGGVLSCALDARGPLYDLRPTEEWAAVNLDLTTGADITLADLFLDEPSAMEAIEAYLWDTVAPEMSAHLENGELTPVPDCFTISAQGLTLYYPIRQLSTLSGRAGSVTLHWSELRAHLRLGEGTVLRRIGAEDAVNPGPHTAQAVAACVAAGQLPGLPVALGDDMEAVIAAYRRLYDPDLYEGGRMFTLEDDTFRQVWMLTDGLAGKDVTGSVVQGIRADRLDLFGLCTGETTREAWQALLGTPDATVTVDEARAESYRLTPGISDYYIYGAHRLRLHADEAGILRSVFLIP